MRPGKIVDRRPDFRGAFWMWAEVVGGMRFFYTQILEGSGLIAPLSNPDLTVTLIAIHS